LVGALCFIWCGGDMGKIRFDCIPIIKCIDPRMGPTCGVYVEPLRVRIQRAVIRFIAYALIAVIYIGWIALCIHQRYPQGIMPLAMILGVYIGIRVAIWLSDY
jgi:hypothetical protein